MSWTPWEKRTPYTRVKECMCKGGCELGSTLQRLCHFYSWGLRFSYLMASWQYNAYAPCKTFNKLNAWGPNTGCLSPCSPGLKQPLSRHCLGLTQTCSARSPMGIAKKSLSWETLEKFLSSLKFKNNWSREMTSHSEISCRAKKCCQQMPPQTLISSETNPGEQLRLRTPSKPHEEHRASGLGFHPSAFLCFFP